MPSPLASGFENLVTYKHEDGRVARVEPLEWWEEAPGARSKLPEQFPADIDLRKSRWYRLLNAGPGFIRHRVVAGRSRPR